MSNDAAFVFGLIGVAGAMMASNRVDQVHDALIVGRDSPLAGRSIAESELESRYRVRILGLMRRGRRGDERTVAGAIGVSPYPFAVAVLIAASAAYSTPVSTPVVTLVVEPGRYKFTDFVKVGVPLLFLTYLVTLFVAPLIFPFGVS